jgi:hypothetical protein
MAHPGKEHLATGHGMGHASRRATPAKDSGHRLRTSLTTGGLSARTSSSFSFPTKYRDPCCRKSLRYFIYTTLGHTDPATVVDNKGLGQTRCGEADSVQARRPRRQRIECSRSGWWCLGTKSLAANAGPSSRAMIFTKQSLIDRKTSDAVRM